MISVAPTGNKLAPSPNPTLDLTVDDLTEYERPVTGPLYYTIYRHFDTVNTVTTTCTDVIVNITF